MPQRTCGCHRSRFAAAQARWCCCRSRRPCTCRASLPAAARRWWTLAPATMLRCAHILAGAGCWGHHGQAGLGRLTCSPACGDRAKAGPCCAATGGLRKQVLCAQAGLPEGAAAAAGCGAAPCSALRVCLATRAVRHCPRPGPVSQAVKDKQVSVQKITGALQRRMLQAQRAQAAT